MFIFYLQKYCQKLIFLEANYNSVKALVINLENSTDRMNFMRRQLNFLSIDYHRLEAIDGSKLSNEFYSKHLNNWERPLRKSEVACFMSHKKAWEYVVNENKPFLVLEDDIILGSKTNEIINFLEEAPLYSFVNLETSYRRKFLSKRRFNIDNKFKLHELYHNKCGAAAYIIWPSVAKFLISNFKKDGAALADSAIYNNFFKLKQYQVMPALAIQAHDCDKFNIEKPFSHASIISADKKPSKRHPLIISWKRLKTQILIVLVYIIYCKSGIRKKISFSKY